MTRLVFDAIVDDLGRRRGLVHTEGARAIFAACSRLDKLQNTLEKSIREYRREAYHAQFDSALAGTPPAFANPDGRDPRRAENFPIHKRSIVHELAGPITEAKNRLKTVLLTPVAVAEWRIQSEQRIAMKVDLLLSDSTVITRRLAIRDAMKPEHRHPDPTLDDA